MSVHLASDLPFVMVRHMGNLMDQLQKGYYNFYPGENWVPQVNLYETADTYLVCVDLAGVEKEKIDLQVNGHQLILRGSRPVPTAEQAGGPGRAPKIRVHLMEIDHGPFMREVELPHDVIKEQIRAEYRNGLLWVTLPKK